MCTRAHHDRSFGIARASEMRRGRVALWSSVALIAGTLPALAQTVAPFQMQDSDLAGFAAGAPVPGPFQMLRSDVTATTSYTGAASAGNAALTTNPSETIVFADTATAGDAAIINNTGGATRFYDDSTAGAALITNNGTLQFSDRATAGSGAIVNNSAGAMVFTDQATAGDAALTNNGTLVFRDQTTSGSKTLTNNATGGLHFADTSTTGQGVFNNGLMVLSDSATATGFSTNNLGGKLLLRDQASLGASALTNSGTAVFAGSSTAASASLVNNATGVMAFIDGATAAQAVINNGGMLYFQGNSDAGSAVILTQTDATTIFAGNASGAAAELRLDTGGVVDFSSLSGNGTSVGSILGTGTIALGSKQLTVGSNDLDTTVSGLVDGGIAGGTGGSLVKTGAGVLRLDGANTYTGATIVRSGTLQAANANAFAAQSATSVEAGARLDIAGSDQTIGSLAGAGIVMLATNTLTVGGDNSSTEFSGALTEAGGLTKTGTGTLTLSGISSHLGTTRVQQGTLQVDGDIASSALNVTGGTLSGRGTVGTTTIAAGGTIAPGPSATLSVAGDLTVATGATYRVDLSGAASSAVNASGTASVDGARLALGSVSAFDPTANYTILIATGGISGQFDTSGTSYAFIVPELSYQPDAVLMTLARNGVAFDDIAATANQRAVANAVERLGQGNVLYGQVIIADTATALSAFDQLSGELHASVQTGLLEQSRMLANTALTRATSLHARTGPWAQAWTQAGQLSTADVHTLDFNGSGFVAGFDTAIDSRFAVGAFAGASTSRFSLAGLNGSADATAAHLAVYARFTEGPWRATAGAAITAGEVRTARAVRFGSIDDHLTASYGQRSVQLFGDVAYRLDLDRFTLEPFVAARFVTQDTDGFTEQGGPSALSVAGTNTQSIETTVGLRASADLELQRNPVKLTAMAGWRHRFDTDPTSTSMVISGQGFAITGVNSPSDALVIEAGVSMALNPHVSLGLTYGGEYSDAGLNHSIRLNIAGRF